MHSGRTAVMLACWLCAAHSWAGEPSPFDLPRAGDFKLTAGGWAQVDDTAPAPSLPQLDAFERPGNSGDFELSGGNLPGPSNCDDFPGDICFTLRGDLRAWPCSLWGDLRSVFRPKPILILVGAGLGSLAIRRTVDDDIANNVYAHPNRWGESTEVLSILGNPGHQIAFDLGLYFWSLHTQNAELHEFSTTLMNALVISNSTNYLLKIAANGSTPNGEPQGWPSGHCESTMCFAAVVQEYYGWKAALPVYTLAGAVSFARIDDSEHYLSDVVFGLALGYVVGRTVARHHHYQVAGGDVIVTADPFSGTQMLGWLRTY